MATNMVDSLLTSLPLELRHKCFEYAAVRDTKPKNLLRYWFEKKEVKDLIATAAAANPTGPAPTVVYQQECGEEDSDVPQPDDDEDGEDDDGEDGEDGEDDDGEDDNEEENEDGDGDDMADQDQAIQSAIIQAQYAALPLGHPSAAPTATQTQTQTQAPQVSADDQASASELEADDEEVDAAADQANVPAANTTAGGSQDADGDETMTENDEDEETAENDEDEEIADNDDEDGDGGDGDASAAAHQQPIPPPPVPVVAPARKWRHIPNFMRLTHCPPPVELLLASKQLNNEAKNWFYDVAVLRINATGAFAHTSFFEEAFTQITEAAFSPMENVRKVEVLFSWDTTWLRADTTGCAEAIFPALLRQRSEFVHKILSQAPDLKDVTIHWHDSAEDDESANFKLDILAPFHSLNAQLAIKEHYIAANAKPNSRSIAGQRRVEFQAIMDAGLDRLF